MAKAFNVVAELQLRGPSQANLNATVGRVRKAMSGATGGGGVGGSAGNTQKLSSGLSATAQTMGQVNKQAAAAAMTLQGVNNAAREGADFLSNLGLQAGLAARRFAAFAAATTAIFQLISGVREGISQAIQFEVAMNKVAQVSGGSALEIKALQNEISRLSVAFGVSSQELANTAVTLKQAGMSAQDVKTAMEALAKSDLAPNFKSLKDTTEGVIASWRQFKLGASDFESVLSSVNEVAGNFAVEASDIVTAIQKAGGAFASMNGPMTDGKKSLMEFVGLFTSVRATTRESADTIATGLRTIFTRLQRADTVDALKSLGINLRYTAEEAKALGDVNLENQFVGAYDAIERLSKGLGKLRETDPVYSGIIEQLGGYRQISKVIPLLKQQGDAQKAVNIGMAGQISLQVAAERRQGTLANKIDSLKQRYLELFRTMVDSSGFQRLASSLIKLAEGFSKVIEFASPLLPLLTTIAAVKLTQGLGSFIGNFARSFMAPVGSALPVGQAPVKRNKGGFIPGVGDSDTVPAQLTPGEFVIKKSSAKKLGAKTLHELNQNPQRFKIGGKVRDLPKLPQPQTTRGILNPPIENPPNEYVLNTSIKDDFDVALLLAKTGYKKKKEDIPYTPQTKLVRVAYTKVAKQKNFNAVDLAVNKNAQKLGESSSLFNEGRQTKQFGDYPLTQKEIDVYNSSYRATKAEKEPHRFDTDQKTTKRVVPVINVRVKSFPLDRTQKASYKKKDGSKSKGYSLRQVVAYETGKAIISSANKFSGTPVDYSPRDVFSRLNDGAKGSLVEETVRLISGITTDDSKQSLDFPIITEDIAKFYDPSLVGRFGDMKSNDKASTFKDVAKKAIAFFGIKQMSGKDFGTFAQQGLDKLPLKLNIGGTTPGSGNEDTVPALLTPGEFVINKRSAQRIGYDKLRRMNATGEAVQKFAHGGGVGVQRFAGGNKVENIVDNVMLGKKVESKRLSPEQNEIYDKIANEVPDILQSMKKFGAALLRTAQGIAASSNTLRSFEESMKEAARLLTEKFSDSLADAWAAERNVTLPSEDSGNKEKHGDVSGASSQNRPSAALGEEGRKKFVQGMIARNKTVQQRNLHMFGSDYKNMGDWTAHDFEVKVGRERAELIKEHLSPRKAKSLPQNIQEFIYGEQLADPQEDAKAVRTPRKRGKPEVASVATPPPTPAQQVDRLLNTGRKKPDLPREVAAELATRVKPGSSLEELGKIRQVSQRYGNTGDANKALVEELKGRLNKATNQVGIASPEQFGEFKKLRSDISSIAPPSKELERAMVELDNAIKDRAAALRKTARLARMKTNTPEQLEKFAKKAGTGDEFKERVSDFIIALGQKIDEATTVVEANRLGKQAERFGKLPGQNTQGEMLAQSAKDKARQIAEKEAKEAEKQAATKWGDKYSGETDNRKRQEMTNRLATKAMAGPGALAKQEEFIKNSGMPSADKNMAQAALMLAVVKKIADIPTTDRNMEVWKKDSRIETGVQAEDARRTAEAQSKQGVKKQQLQDALGKASSRKEFDRILSAPANAGTLEQKEIDALISSKRNEAKQRAVLGEEGAIDDFQAFGGDRKEIRRGAYLARAARREEQKPNGQRKHTNEEIDHMKNVANALINKDDKSLVGYQSKFLSGTSGDDEFIKRINRGKEIGVFDNEEASAIKQEFFSRKGSAALSGKTVDAKEKKKYLGAEGKDLSGAALDKAYAIKIGKESVGMQALSASRASYDEAMRAKSGNVDAQKDYLLKSGIKPADVSAMDDKQIAAAMQAEVQKKQKAYKLTQKRVRSEYGVTEKTMNTGKINREKERRDAEAKKIKEEEELVSGFDAVKNNAAMIPTRRSYEASQYLKKLGKTHDNVDDARKNIEERKKKSDETGKAKHDAAVKGGSDGVDRSKELRERVAPIRARQAQEKIIDELLDANASDAQVSSRIKAFANGKRRVEESMAEQYKAKKDFRAAMGSKTTPGTNGFEANIGERIENYSSTVKLKKAEAKAAIEAELYARELAALRKIYGDQKTSAELVNMAQKNTADAMSGKKATLGQGKAIITADTAKAAAARGINTLSDDFKPDPEDYKPKPSMWQRMKSWWGGKGPNGPTPPGGPGGPGGPGEPAQPKDTSMRNMLMMMAIPMLLPHLNKLIVGTDTAEGAVKGGSETSFTYARGIDGGTSGAVTGFAVGNSIGGPIGGIIGALGGALLGFTDAVSQAHIEILNAKIGIALQRLGDTMSTISEIGAANASAGMLSSAKSDIKTINETTKEKVQYEHRGNWYLFRLNASKQSTVDAAMAKEQRQNYASQMPTFMGILQDSAEKLGRNGIGRGIDDLQNSLRSGNDGLNKELISIIASLKYSGDEAQVLRDLRKNILAGQEKRVTERGEIDKARLDENFGNNLSRLALAIGNSADRFLRLNQAADVLIDTLNGSTSIGKTSLRAEGLSTFGAFDSSFAQSTKIFSNLIGGKTGETATEVNSTADAIAKVLPEIISRAVSSSGQTDFSVPTFIKNELTKSLGKQGEGENAQRIIGSIVSQISKETEGKDGRVEFLKNVEKGGFEYAISLIKDAIGKPLEQQKNVLNAIQQNLDDIATSVDKMSSVRQKIGETRDGLANLQVSAYRSNVENWAAANGRRNQAADFMTFGNLEYGANKRQERLTGEQGDNAFDANIIAGRLRAAQEAAVAGKTRLQEMATTSGQKGPDYAKAADALSKMNEKVVNLQQALANAANASERVAVAQEKLARIDDERSSRRSMAEKVATADPEELMRMNRGVMLVNQVAGTGDMTNMMLEDRKLLIETLRSAGNATLTGVQGAPKASDLLDKLLANFQGGAFDLTGAQKSEESQLRQVIAERFKNAEKAMEAMISHQSNTLDGLAKILESKQEQFLSRLEVIMTQNSIATATSNKLALESQLSGTWRPLKETKDKVLDFGGFASGKKMEAKDIADFARMAGTMQSYLKNYRIFTDKNASEDDRRKAGKELDEQLPRLNKYFAGSSANVNSAIIGLAGKNLDSQEKFFANLSKMTSAEFSPANIDDKVQMLTDTISSLTESLGKLNKELKNKEEAQPVAVGNNPDNRIVFSASGGGVDKHPGSPRGTDTVPAWLTPGEFVVNAASAQANAPLLERINNSKGPMYLAEGGPVSDDKMTARLGLEKDSYEIPSIMVIEQEKNYGNYMDSISEEKFLITKPNDFRHMIKASSARRISGGEVNANFVSGKNSRFEMYTREDQYAITPHLIYENDLIDNKPIKEWLKKYFDTPLGMLFREEMPKINIPGDLSKPPFRKDFPAAAPNKAIYMLRDIKQQSLQKQIDSEATHIKEVVDKESDSFLEKFKLKIDKDTVALSQLKKEDHAVITSNRDALSLPFIAKYVNNDNLLVKHFKNAGNTSEFKSYMETLKVLNEGMYAQVEEQINTVKASVDKTNPLLKDDMSDESRGKIKHSEWRNRFDFAYTQAKSQFDVMSADDLGKFVVQQFGYDNPQKAYNDFVEELQSKRSEMAPEQAGLYSAWTERFGKLLNSEDGATTLKYLSGGKEGSAHSIRVGATAEAAIQGFLRELDFVYDAPMLEQLYADPKTDYAIKNQTKIQDEFRKKFAKDSPNEDQYKLFAFQRGVVIYQADAQRRINEAKQAKAAEDEAAKIAAAKARTAALMEAAKRDFEVAAILDPNGSAAIEKRRRAINEAAAARAAELRKRFPGRFKPPVAVPPAAPAPAPVAPPAKVDLPGVPDDAPSKPAEKARPKEVGMFGVNVAVPEKPADPKPGVVPPPVAAAPGVPAVPGVPGVPGVPAPAPAPAPVPEEQAAVGKKTVDEMWAEQEGLGVYQHTFLKLANKRRGGGRLTPQEKNFIRGYLADAKFDQSKDITIRMESERQKLRAVAKDAATRNNEWLRRSGEGNTDKATEDARTAIAGIDESQDINSLDEAGLKSIYDVAGNYGLSPAAAIAMARRNIQLRDAGKIRAAQIESDINEETKKNKRIEDAAMKAPRFADGGKVEMRDSLKDFIIKKAVGKEAFGTKTNSRGKWSSLMRARSSLVGGEGQAAVAQQLAEFDANFLETKFSKDQDWQKFIDETNPNRIMVDPKVKVAPNPIGLATGGIVPGVGNTDSVPAMLTPGEFVINRPSAQRIGKDNLQMLNSGGFVQGGGVAGGGGSGGNNEAVDSLSETLRGFVQQMGGFSQVASNLAQSFAQFSGSSQALVEALNNMPRMLTIEGNHNVVVSLNGAEVLAKLTPEIQAMIMDTIRASLGRIFKEQMPDAGINPEV